MSALLAHLNALETAITAAGFDVYLVNVERTLPPYPYVLLWHDADDELSESLCNSRNELQFDFGVTVAGLSPASVLVVKNTVRNIVLKGVQVPGWYVNQPVYKTGQGVRVDTAVPLDAGAVNPYFAVDVYALTSQKLI